MPTMPLQSFASTLVLLVGLSLLPAGEVNFTQSSPLLALSEMQRSQQVQARMAATPLAWPGGRMTAAEAVTLLSASGNATVLADPADAVKVAQVPPLAGDYWQGVIAVCGAFGLNVEPGEAFEQVEDNGLYPNRENSGTALVTTGGPVVLRAFLAESPRPLYVACGAILAEVKTFDVHHRKGAITNRSVDVRLSLRMEPRVQPMQIGTTLVTWSSVEDALGRRLSWSSAVGPWQSDVNALTLSEVPENFSGCTLVGELLVQTLEPVTLSATVRPGDKARASLLGQEVSLQLIGEGETTASGQRGPGFILSVPTAVLGARPKLAVSLGGQPVKINSQGTNWSGVRVEFFYRAPKLLDGDYVATLTGQAAMQQVRLPLKVPATLAGLSVPKPPVGSSLDLQVPTQVRWDAGECDVAEAVRRLAASNQVLLELGADERRRATLTAFDGTFWEAALVICRAFDLTILPPSQVVLVQDDDGKSTPTCVTGGPLCLGQRQGERSTIDLFQASGILLMGLDALTVDSKHGLGGVTRQAELSYRLRLEPRFDASLIGSATIRWASLAGSTEGRPMAVEEANTQTTNEDGAHIPIRNFRFGRRREFVAASDQVDQAAASGRVLVSGLPTGPVPLVLSGQVSLQLRRTVRCELPLSPGGRGTVRLGERTAMVKMFSASPEEEGSERAGVSVELSGDEVDALAVEVRDAAGKTLRSNGSGNSVSIARSRMIWYFAGLEQGPFTVVLTGRERMGLLRLPFSFSVTTP